MRTVDLIQKKRDGEALTAEEIQYLIEGYSRGEIPDYQMSAWAMAVYFQGMTARETADLTMSMARSGDQLDLSPIRGRKVDKHSTGGVGDKTTLVVGPLVAAAGVPVAKMSGRGLGHTGGTIDKLEAITGFSVEQTKEQFMEQVNRDGIAIISQTGNITPADKKLYGLRDVTATVNSIPLIASSVMSKKIASGADAIVLDVKTGDGAFMKELDDAKQLAKAMVDIGSEVGRDTMAVISDMDQPLGFAVGNALEVKEAIMTLRGEGPKDLEELSLVLGAYMLVLGHKAATFDEAKSLLRGCITNGSALEKFKQFVAAQGGNPELVDRMELLPSAKHEVEVVAASDGYVNAIHAEAIGTAAMMLGAGRQTKESTIDLSVGIVLRKKVGDAVKAGQSIALLHANDSDPASLKNVVKKVSDAFQIRPNAPEQKPLIYAVVTKDGIEDVSL